MFLSCQWFPKEQKKEAIARVGDSYLYRSEITGLFSGKMNPEDSLQLLQNFINNWAKKQLLIEKAMANLSDQKLAELETLIQNYKADLYMNAYQEALIAQSLDTVVTEGEMETFYEENKENFRLNEEVLKMRYICFNKSSSYRSNITTRFKRFTAKDKKVLDSIAIQFKSYSFNDSIWVKLTQVVEKIPVITPANKENYLKKSQFFELQDSLSVYLVYVNDIAKAPGNAPLDYVKPTVQQIILNMRKVALIRALEKDIIEDATRKKQFEIYENL